MSVKVGLVTSPGSPPSPSRKPRVKVVFPAPRSPDRPITQPGSACAPSLRPSAIVCSASSVKSSTSLPEVGAAHFVVVGEVARLAGERDLSRLEAVGAVRNRKSHARILLDQQDRHARLVDAGDRLE